MLILSTWPTQILIYDDYRRALQTSKITAIILNSANANGRLIVDNAEFASTQYFALIKAFCFCSQVVPPPLRAIRTTY